MALYVTSFSSSHSTCDLAPPLLAELLTSVGFPSAPSPAPHSTRAHLRQWGNQSRPRTQLPVTTQGMRGVSQVTMPVTMTVTAPVTAAITTPVTAPITLQGRGRSPVTRCQQPTPVTSRFCGMQPGTRRREVPGAHIPESRWLRCSFPGLARRRFSSKPPPAAPASSGEVQGQLEEHREASEGEGEVLRAAWEILGNFNVCDIKGLPQPSLQSPEGIVALAASVQLAASAVREEKGVLPLLGVCAGSPGECHVAAQEWTAALGFTDLSEGATWQRQLEALEGPVYLKLNVATRACQASPYPGKYRGVIVQLADKQVGHLPLRLFRNSGN